MEHIVQFAIGIDDEAIRKHVEEHSVEVIEKQIKQDVINKIFQTKYYRNDANPHIDSFSDYAKGIIVDVMTDYKDEIIQLTAEILAEKLCRTKAAKELIGAIKD